MKCIVNIRYEFVNQIVFIPPFVDDAVFAVNLSIKLGRVDPPAVVQIRAYNNQGLYSPASIMASAVFPIPSH